MFLVIFNSLIFRNDNHEIRPTEMNLIVIVAIARMKSKQKVALIGLMLEYGSKEVHVYDLFTDSKVLFKNYFANLAKT